MQTTPAWVEPPRPSRQPALLASNSVCVLPAAARTLLLPDIFQLLEGTPQAQLRRAELRARTAERENREETDFRAALASAAQAPRFSDLVMEAERKMLPGTLAARRAEVSALFAAHREGSPDHLGTPAGTGDTQKGPGSAQETVVSPERSAQLTALPAPGATAAPAAARTAQATAAPSLPTTHAGPDPLQALAANLRAGSTSAAAAVAQPANGVVPAPAATGVVTPIEAPSVAGRAGAGQAGAGAEPAGRQTPTVAAAASTETLRGATATRARAPQGSAPAGTNDANVERLVRVVLARMGKDRSVATLGLEPPELGRVRVRMDLHAERLALRIDAETESARRLLVEQLDALRRSLEATGIQLERVEVRRIEPQHDPRDTGPQGHAGAWGDGQSGPDRRDAQGSVNSRASGMEAISPEPSIEPAVNQGDGWSAAEPLVNIWA